MFNDYDYGYVYVYVYAPAMLIAIYSLAFLQSR